ncbi:MAG: ABC transporter substrate-binding protein [Deltaproteobacteria bacterium]|nr:ABC transporter substrate-binding protein [Deltaproteobacteria bacterium]
MNLAKLLIFQHMLLVCALGNQSKIHTIGVVLPLTGRDSAYGTSIQKGILTAELAINRAGGIKGHKLNIVFVDDRSGRSSALDGYKGLVQMHKPIAIIGGITTESALAIAPMAERHKIPTLSPTATGDGVTEKSRYLFRVCFTNRFQGTALARLAIEHLGIRRAAILVDSSDPYSQGISENFRKTFQSRGGSVVAQESLQLSAAEVEKVLSAIKSKKPQAVVLATHYERVASMAHQMKKVGLRAVLLGGDSWDTFILPRDHASDLDGSYYVTHFSPDEQAPQVRNFVSEFKKVHSQIPMAFSALGYDALKMIASAIERAKDVSTEQIRNALSEIRNFPGVTGYITVNKSRNTTKSAVVMQIADGGVQYIRSIPP